ncbi:O-antigen ligase family protein [Patescibacteria group bacterium]|nr:O-antigen ligase family protein [Patescibacteria group bacterium]
MSIKNPGKKPENNMKLWLIIGFIFLFEIFSFYGFLLPNFRNAAFFIIAILVLILSLIRLEYGIYVLLAELFIGSQGYLFYYEIDGFKISIRITLWLIVIGAWLIHVFKLYENHRYIPNIFKKKIRVKFFEKIRDKLNNFVEIPLDKRQNKTKFINNNNKALPCFYFLKSDFFPYYLALFIFVTWGVINGFLNQNSFNNIFFDINGWLYFLLIFPVYAAFDKKEFDLYVIYKIFLASIIWLSIKTFFLLFIFSHNMTSIISEVYKWVRVTGVGEITQMNDSFYRIFFQSHIYILIGFFIFLTLASKNSRFKIQNLSIMCCLLSVILISFSRSFWVGLIVGIFLYFCFIVWSQGFKKLIHAFGLLLITFILSACLIVGIVKFPYPSPFGNFNAAQIFGERATKITGEAAVSSRWELLPKLGEQILKNPFLGQGFGATVTYKTSDPRVLESNATGYYTAYAFEWGWLDVWLKIGLFGFLAYLFLIGKILKSGFELLEKSKYIKTFHCNVSIIGLLIGLVVIMCVNVFTPYLNHPLGIGYLILVSVIVDKLKN